MSDIEFIPGLIAKAPNPNAPDFVKASLSIKRAELIAWLQGRTDEWVNADIKESGKSGKWYVAVNAYKREESQDKPQQRTPNRQDHDSYAPYDKHADAGSGFVDDDLPF